MKSQILAVLLFCLVCSWIVARVFQMESHQDCNREKREAAFRPAETTPDTGREQEVGPDYEELSMKRINYLIP